MRAFVIFQQLVPGRRGATCSGMSEVWHRFSIGLDGVGLAKSPSTVVVSCLGDHDVLVDDAFNQCAVH